MWKKSQKFTCTTKVKVIDIIKPKSAYVLPLELQVGDEIMMAVYLRDTTGGANGNYALSVELINTRNSKSKFVTQNELFSRIINEDNPVIKIIEL